MKGIHKYSILIILISLLHVSCGNDDDDQASDPDDDTIIVTDRLPQLFIGTNGANIVDEPKIDSELVIIEAGEETHRVRIGIEIRGSSSQGFPKKSYGFETRDDTNEDLDVSLLGYAEEEDWILYAPYSDKSLVRNHLMYELSNEMGRYASKTTLVDVFLNDTYQGIYVFMEKLKRDDNRIDINKLKDDENSGEDLTGGYILKIDKADGSSETLYTDQNSFTSAFAPLGASSSQEINFLYEEPSQDDITPEQKTYISDYVGAFENALASDDFMNATTGYANYIDTVSFIDFFLLNELSNNVDGYRISTWLTKDKNEKLKMGPVWDFNLAFGNANYCNGSATNTWAYRFNERCSNDIWQVPFWWSRLLEDPTFVSQLKERWTLWRGNVLSETAIMNKIDSYVFEMRSSGSIEENFVIWPVIGTFVWPNDFIGDSYEDEINYLKGWISDRLSWMDGEIARL